MVVGDGVWARVSVYAVGLVSGMLMVAAVVPMRVAIAVRNSVMQLLTEVVTGVGMSRAPA